MATALAESTTKTYTVTPGQEYSYGIAGTWDGMTVTLQWSDGTTDVAFVDGALTDDGGLVFIAPTNTIKVVSGADSSNAGALTFSIYETLEGKASKGAGMPVA